MGKGGESMSLEAIKQVTEAELTHKQRKAEAQAEAKRTVAEAERAGKARLAEARAQAEAQVRAFMKQAEETAAKHAAQVNGETQKTCDALRSKAEGRLAQAAESIVRRVVKS